MNHKVKTELLIVPPESATFEKIFPASDHEALHKIYNRGSVKCPFCDVLVTIASEEDNDEIIYFIKNCEHAVIVSRTKVPNQIIMLFKK